LEFHILVTVPTIIGAVNPLLIFGCTVTEVLPIIAEQFLFASLFVNIRVPFAGYVYENLQLDPGNTPADGGPFVEFVSAISATVIV
jgi:hypothetical protein